MKANWSKLLKIIIAVLTALAGALGVASCTTKNDNVNADAKGASVATAARSISAACDEGRFIFPEECALAPLGLSSPRSMLKHSCKSLRPCTSGVLVLSPTDSHESAQISQVALPLLASGVSAEGSQLTAHGSSLVAFARCCSSAVHLP